MSPGIPLQTMGCCNDGLVHGLVPHSRK
jgi:hypothetical protein